MKPLELKGMNVMVTGSSRGLGLALVHELSRREAKQIFAGCKTEEGCLAIESLRLSNVRPLLLDVSNPAHIAQVRRTVSALDVLINNAGIASVGGYMSENARKRAEAEMKTHYFGPLMLVQEVLPLLKQSLQAGVINISSIAGLSNFKMMGTYSASKASLHFLTQGLRAELSQSGIFVQGVYPGPFKTRLSEGFDGPKPSPAEIAAAILDAFENREMEIFPDDFSRAMHQIFIESPKKLDAIFSEVTYS